MGRERLPGIGPFTPGRSLRQARWHTPWPAPFAAWSRLCWAWCHMGTKAIFRGALRRRRGMEIQAHRRGDQWAPFGQDPELRECVRWALRSKRQSRGEPRSVRKRRPKLDNYILFPTLIWYPKIGMFERRFFLQIIILDIQVNLPGYIWYVALAWLVACFFYYRHISPIPMNFNATKPSTPPKKLS